MPVPVPDNTLYARVNFGLVPSLSFPEHASIGWHGTRIHTVGNTVDWPSDLQGWAESLVEKFAADWTPFASHICSWVTAQSVETYLLEPATGKVQEKGMAEFSGDNSFNGSASSYLPPECALVISTYGYTPGAFTQDAKAKRGRFYFPGPCSADLSNDGSLGTSSQTAWATQAGVWLNDLQGSHIGDGPSPSTSDYFDLRIMSTRRNKAARSTAVLTPITAYRVGRVIDAQRRRRNQLDEAYINGTVAHS